MKIGKTKLKMSSGKIRKFKSQRARNRFEKVAQAIKGGWRPKKKFKAMGKHHSGQMEHHKSGWF